MEKFVFNKIFSRYDEYGYINFIFSNLSLNKAIYFDGITFFLKRNSDISFENFRELDYKKFDGGMQCFIEDIRQKDFSIIYIKLNNGDLFQVYFTLDPQNTWQMLSIFNEKSDSFGASDIFINFANSEEMTLE